MGDQAISWVLKADISLIYGLKPVLPAKTKLKQGSNGAQSVFKSGMAGAICLLRTPLKNRDRACLLT